MFNLKSFKHNQFLHRKELLQLNRLYATLSQINHAIVRIQKKDPLFQEICEIAIKYGEFRMAWIGLIDDSHKFITSAASAGKEQGYINDIHIPLTDTTLGNGPTGEAVKEGRCVFCQDIATDPRMKPWRKEALQRGFRSSAAIPIRQNNEVIGAFMVYSAEKMIFDLKEKQLLEEIGNEISFALDMMERENQRKLAFKDLKISENRFKDLLENIHLISIILDVKGKLTFCNPYFLELTGYTYKDIIGTNWFESMIPEAQQEIIKEIFKTHEKGEIVSHTENAILTKDGAPRTIRWSNTVLRDAAGKVIETASIGEDITESRQAEQALKESEERLRLSTELAKVAVWEHHIGNKTMSRSKNHDQLYGLEWQEKWDMDAFLNATYPDDREISTSTMQQSVAPGGSDNYTFDIRVVHPDKTIHWLNLTGQVVERDKDGQGIMIRGTLIEVTNRKIVESEIKKLNEELELRVKQRTNELQSAILELETFTYSVSHDLKAPLRGIDGYGKLLLDLYGADLNEEAKYFITTIRTSTQQMNQLIDDLLEYSRLEKSQLIHENIYIKTFVSDLVSVYQTVLEHDKFTVTLKVPDIEIKTDPTALRIALRNLLENALKFTKKQANPTIEIGLNEGESFWLLYVKDNGIGFNMNYHDRIFDIFQRLHKAEDYNGTGIGLAMVKKAMQKINGNVWAESIPDKGSVFNLELPKTH